MAGGWPTSSRAATPTAGSFAPDDCDATFRELSDPEVIFLREPTERVNRIDAVFRDPVGNWFSLAQPIEVST